MSEPTKAVFLSYASQDAEAARRICDVLRSGGVEVWFDADGGLEHGDEWDVKIRRQIKECVLFIPVISANTQARHEGYFRIEWDLAAERARGIASGVPFILPVVIDDTREPDALVPDRFRAVQWTKLRGGEVPPEVQQRFLKLWSHRTGVLKHEATQASAPEVRAAPSAAETIGKPGVKNYALIAAAIAVIVAGVGWWLLGGRSKPAAPSRAPAIAVTPANPAPATAPLSEARQLAEKARALFDALDGTRDDYKLAEELIAQAKTKDGTDAEVCAAEAQLHERFIQRGWDSSDARREAARAAVQRAMRLDPQSFEARFAQAFLLSYTGSDGLERTRQMSVLRRERPTDQRILRALGTGLDRLGRLEEAIPILDESAALPGGDPLALYTKSQIYWWVGRTAEAEAAIEASIAQKPFTGALLMNVWYKTTLHGDLDSAWALLNRINPAELVEDRACFFAFCIEWYARRPDAAIAHLSVVPRDWLNDNFYRGPKALLVGDAQQLAGRPDAAALEWRAALKLVDQRLAASPNDWQLLSHRVGLLVRLGQREEAERLLGVLTQLLGSDADTTSRVLSRAYTQLGRQAEAISQISAGLKRGKRAVLFTAADLRLNPSWDPLRSEPAFAAVIAEAEAIEKAAALQSGGGGGAALAPAADAKSVAVLAFANLSDDKGNEYFSDGISEELLNVLAKVPGLKVTARTSAFFFKGKNLPIPEIARQLGVAYVIEGSVQRAGENVRITAQLIKAADGFHVWSEHFDRELKNVFALQDEIAGLIANQLSLKLGASSAAAATSVNPQALEFYLQANQLMRLRDTIFINTDRVEELLNRALALEPNFARAQAMLAVVWTVRGSLQSSSISRFGQRHSPERARIEAKARQAIALDPTAPEPHVALAMGMWTWWDRAGAENELHTALSLNPSHAVAHQQLGIMAMDDGRMDDAIAEVRLAVQLDPLSQDSIESLARKLHVAGRYTEAIATYDRALALADSEVAREHKAYALAQLGQKEAALALARSLSLEWLRFRTFAAAGAWAEAEKTFPTTAPENRAYYLFMLGRTEEGLAALNPAEMESTYLHDVLFEPWFDPVREDPRFKKFLETLGVTESHARAQAWRKAHPAEKSEAKK